MSTITTKDEATIFYKDSGPKDAQPIVFHHGWPLSSDDWDVQMLFFLANGYRVVAHDRRGHRPFHFRDHRASCDDGTIWRPRPSLLPTAIAHRPWSV